MIRAIIRHFRADDLETIKELYTAYATYINVDLTFQNYQDEFDSLPGKYAASYGGALLVAERIDEDTIDHLTSKSSRQVIGSIAVRRLSENRCELKRLYVRPDARGLKAGHALVEAAIKEAKQLGYISVVLDSLDWLTTAIAIYEREGFKYIEPYYFNPHKGVVFLEKTLTLPQRHAITSAM